MANPYHGEVCITLNDEALPMRLSLGSLATIEAEMEEDSLMSLVERFESGRFKTSDLTLLLFAGLAGAGWTGTKEDLLAAHIDGGPIGAARSAGELLRVTFGMPE